MRLFSGEVDDGTHDTGNPGQNLLHSRGATAARHPRDRQNPVFLRDMETRLLNRLAHGRQINDRVGLQQRRFGRETDGGPGNAGQATQQLFYAGSATAAGHALNADRQRLT